MNCCKSITNDRFDKRLKSLQNIQMETEILDHINEKVIKTQQALDIKRAADAAAFKATQKAEVEYKLKQNELLKTQLEDITQICRKQQEQAKVFASFIESISEKLTNPQTLFPLSTVAKAEALEDYYMLEFKDGRRINIPNGAINLILKSYDDYVKEQFKVNEENLASLENRAMVTSNNINKLTNIFGNLITDIAAKEEEQNAKNLQFQTELYTRLAETEASVKKLAGSLQTIISMITSLNAAVTVLTNDVN